MAEPLGLSGTWGWPVLDRHKRDFAQAKFVQRAPTSSLRADSPVIITVRCSGARPIARKTSGMEGAWPSISGRGGLRFLGHLLALAFFHGAADQLTPGHIERMGSIKSAPWKADALSGRKGA